MRKGRSAVLFALLFVAAGCAAPTGDFGRPRASYFNDSILPNLGAAAAYVRGEPVSFAPHTDDEGELRDLAYAILMPAGDRKQWEGILYELRRTRILPDDRPVFDVAQYSESLLSTAHRSATSRYLRLIEDVRADSGRIGPFFAAAMRVAEMDGVRERALASMYHLSPDDRESAAARIYENRVLVAWVHQRFHERHAAYRLALDRLVVTTPAPVATEAERVLSVLHGRLQEMPQVVQVAALVAPAPSKGAVVISK
jgi:hypothetical protein